METTHNNHSTIDNQTNIEVPNIRGNEKIATEEEITDETNNILKTFSLFASLGRSMNESANHFLADHPAMGKVSTLGKFAA